MPVSLYENKELELTRRHFINSYPPFNLTRPVESEALLQPAELLLYLHIPFCPTICTYCFYKKFGNPSHSVVETYLQYLKREIELFAAAESMRRRRALKTIYIGGGTPTVLTADQLADLMSVVRSHFDCSALQEFSCEIMPHAPTAGADKLTALKELGVTRISFGVESFDEELLHRHNRPCSRELYDRTYQMVCDLQFDNVNVDMMSGLAGATWDTWTADVQSLIRWSPPSTTIYKTEVYYNTTMFAGMRLGKSSPALISDEEEIRHIRHAYQALQQSGYMVDTCASLLREPRFTHLHYRSHFEGSELKGLGLSAHSCFGGALHQNASELTDYYAMLDVGRLPIKRAHRLSARDRISQAMVYGLKYLAVSRAQFVERFGIDMTVLYGPLIRQLVDSGVLTLDDEYLRITPEHYIFVDDVCRQFFLPEYQDMMLAHVERNEVTVSIGRRNQATIAAEEDSTHESRPDQVHTA
jgi:oxygen-independent coproporphyrinogen III oxidase